MCAVIVDIEVQCCVVSQSKVEAGGGCQACPSVSLPPSQIWICLAGIVAVQFSAGAGNSRAVQCSAVHLCFGQAKLNPFQPLVFCLTNNLFY